MEPNQNNLMPPGEVDNEGAMAKADLYKLANYSVKLFKKIQDEDQMESWVQAKITKAADYIASVYHYLEYELKFNEYGAKLENSDVYSESEKRELKNKLNEAREMLKNLKLAQADKLEEAKSPKSISDKDYDGDGKKEPPKDEVWGSRFKAAKKAGKMEESWDDDDEDPDVKKADSELKKRGVKLPKTKADPDKDMSKLAKKSKKDDDLDETYGQGVYESWDDDDEDPDVKKADSELKKRGVKLPKVKHKEVPIKKTKKDTEEELDEVSDQTKKSYRDAAGKDMQKAAKEGDKARVSKRLKGVSASLKEGSKPDFLDLNKNGNKKEPMSKAAKEKKLDELSHSTLKSYADKKGDQMFKDKKPASGKDLTNYRKAIDKMHKKEDDGDVNEAAPSAGLSAKQKSATVKKAKAGGDIGKPGKGFKKVAAAAKKGGAKDPEAVAAAAMWKNIKRESINEGRGIDNFTGDDILALSKIDDLEAMKARAAELIQTPSKKPIKPEKVRYYLGQLDRMHKPAEIVALMYNMLLGGEGQGVIGDRYSMGKSRYHQRFGETAISEWETDPDEEFMQVVESWWDDISDSIESLGVNFPVSPEVEKKIVDKIDDMWGHGWDRPSTEAIAYVVHSKNEDADEGDSGAYDDNDPKHPNWAHRQLDKVDMNESVEVDRLKALTKRLLG